MDDGGETVPLEEILNGNLEQWQTNPKCLRSLFKDHKQHVKRVYEDRKVRSIEKRHKEKAIPVLKPEAPIEAKREKPVKVFLPSKSKLTMPSKDKKSDYDRYMS